MFEIDKDTYHQELMDMLESLGERWDDSEDDLFRELMKSNGLTSDQISNVLCFFWPKMVRYAEDSFSQGVELGLSEASMNGF